MFPGNGLGNMVMVPMVPINGAGGAGGMMSMKGGAGNGGAGNMFPMNGGAGNMFPLNGGAGSMFPVNGGAGSMLPMNGGAGKNGMAGGPDCPPGKLFRFSFIFKSIFQMYLLLSTLSLKCGPLRLQNLILALVTVETYMSNLPKNNALYLPTYQ